MQDFKLPEAVADIIKAANLIIGASTLIWKIYCRLRPARCAAPVAVEPPPVEPPNPAGKPPPGPPPGSPPALWFL